MHFFRALNVSAASKLHNYNYQNKQKPIQLSVYIFSADVFTRKFELGKKCSQLTFLRSMLGLQFRTSVALLPRSGRFRSDVAVHLDLDFDMWLSLCIRWFLRKTSVSVLAYFVGAKEDKKNFNFLSLLGRIPTSFRPSWRYQQFNTVQPMMMELFPLKGVDMMMMMITRPSASNCEAGDTTGIEKHQYN